MAQKNFGVGFPVVFIPLVIAGQRTASQTAIVRFTLPFPAEIVGVQASARASGGTTPTLDVDVQDDGVSVLSSVVAVTAGAVAEATVDATKKAVADESVITVDTTIGGGSPTWDDIFVGLTVVRKG